MTIFKFLGGAALAGIGLVATIAPASAQDQQDCIYVLQDQGAQQYAQQGSTGTNTLSCGNSAFAQGNDSTAIGNGAVTFVDDENSVAIGNNSRTDGANTFAVGGNGVDRRIVHVAKGLTATDAVNLAQLSQVQQEAAIDSANAQATADTASNQAMNAQSTASTALVNAANAQQTADDAFTLASATQSASDTALTNAAAAQSTADTALTNAAAAQTTANHALANTTYFVANADGDVPVASGANSVAIGPGASATRDGQVALGGAGATYTMAGITSDASRAAQQGAVSLVTTDMAGNLATVDVDVAELQSLGGRVDTVENQVAALNGSIDRGFRQANGGIAAAMALGGTVMPPDTRLAVSFNLATYRGEQGFSGAVVARMTDHVWVSGGFAGSTVRGSTGGRVGVTFGW